MWGMRLGAAAGLFLVAAAAGAAPYHDADTSQDNAVGLSELLRVIQFYNSDGLRCEAGTEDGFAPGIGDQSCAPHDADYNAQDWDINLSELLRVIQFYNSDAYYACAGGEDGYCPGIDPGEGEGEGEGVGDEGPEAAFFATVVLGQAPLAVQFIDISKPGSAPIDAWSWSFGDGTDSTEPSPVKTYTNPGTYTVALTVTTALGSDTLTQTDLIGVVALAPATFLGSNPADGEDGVAVTREVVLEFGAPLDPAVLVNAAVTMRRGTQTQFTYKSLSADGRRLTLFPSAPLPGNTTVRVDLDGALLLTADGRNVDVDGDGTPGGTRSIAYTTLGLGALEGTAVCGRVFASALGEGGKGAPVNVPLEGVEVFVDGRFDLTATTDVNGNFRLEPVPAGRFFVHINGLTVGSALIDGVPTPTSFPGGPYYPFVGKAWEAQAGRDTNVGDIFLPLIPEGALTPVGPSAPTAVEFTGDVIDAFPEYAGVRVVVPPNALYNDFGSRGGSVGIAPVAPDRLPSPLPPGLDLPLVITVQTDGPNNFDQPVPACFPNVPDPATGQPLPPGAASALWSFDHDEGDWKIVGTMTVSADGTLVCSDPGHGIIEPGWHGARPGTAPGPLPGPWPGSPPGPAGRCQVNSSDCRDAIGWGALDCIASIIPGLRQFSFVATCGFSVLQAGFGVYRSCTSDDDAGCLISVLAGGGGILAECSRGLVEAVPGLGTVISCGAAVIDATRNCVCITRKGGGGDPELEAFEDLIGFLSAYRSVMLVELGSVRWMDFDPASDRYAEDSLRVADILTALGGTIDPASPGGIEILPAEADALRAMPLPGGFTTADIDALVAYRNTTAAQYALGLFTHAAAGRTDFAGRDQLQAALDALIAATAALDAKGAGPFDPVRAVADFQDYFVASYSDAGAPVPPGEIDYALVDLETGVASRGRLQPNATLRLAALAPERAYRIAYYHLPSRSFARTSFVSAPNGQITPLPRAILFSIDGEPDTDADGLPDLAEEVYNTAAGDDDTDGDGVSDLAELEQGTDPLGGLPQGAGLLANIDTPGEALGVCATNDYVAVADGSAGVAVFNVFNGMPPALVAQVATEGSASSIAGAGPLLAVGCGDAGMAIVDVSDPAAARRTAQLGQGSFDTAVESVAVSGNYAYAARADGRIAVYDLLGVLLDLIDVGEPLYGLSVAGDTLLAIGAANLFAYDLEGGIPVPRGVFAHTRSVGGGLFNAGPVAYYTHFNGYDTVDISDLDNPVQLGRQSGTAIGTFQRVVANGSGIVLCSYSRGFSDWPVGIFDGSDPGDTEALIDEFQTPGNPRDLAVYNGVAYVADDGAGLEVLGYLAADVDGAAPTVTLEIPDSAGGLEANRLALVRANVADDVQVRNVELQVDGARVETDGNFPFEFRLRVPDGSLQSEIEIALIASDTGGSRSAPASQTFAILPDATPPQVLSSLPGAGRAGVAVDEIRLALSEPVDAAALAAGSIVLTALGGDGAVGGGDDAPVPLDTPALAFGGTVAVLTPSAGALAEGIYRLVVAAAALEDRAGNPAAGDTAIEFAALDAGPAGDNFFNRLAGGNWNDPGNWSGGRVPGMGDRAVLRIPARDAVIEIDGIAPTIGGIVTSETLRIGTMGTITVTGDSTLGGTLDLRGVLGVYGTGTRLDIEGPILAQDLAQISLGEGTECAVSSASIIEGLTFTVVNAALDLPVTTAFRKGFLNVSGPSCSLDLPVLDDIDGTRLALNNAPALSLPLVTAYDSLDLLGVGFSVFATTLSLPNLANIGGTLFVGLTAGNGGVLQLDSLATGRDGLDLSINDGTAELDVLTAWHGSISLQNGGVIDAPALAGIDGANISVAGASLLLPNVTAFDGLSAIVQSDGMLGLGAAVSGANATLDVSGIGAELQLGALESLHNSLAIAGPDGSLALPALTAFSSDTTGAIGFTVNANGILDASALETITLDATLNGSAACALTVSGPGSLDLSGLLDTPRTGDTTLSIDASTGSIDLGSLEDLPAGTILGASFGGTVQLDALLALDAAVNLSGAGSTLAAPLLAQFSGSISVSDATLTWPALTAYTIDGESASINVFGETALLELPALAAINLAGDPSSLGVSASGGADILFPLLAAIATPADGNTAAFDASGDGSLINLPTLTTFNPARVAFTESAGGTIARP